MPPEMGHSSHLHTDRLFKIFCHLENKLRPVVPVKILAAPEITAIGRVKIDTIKLTIINYLSCSTGYILEKISVFPGYEPSKHLHQVKGFIIYQMLHCLSSQSSSFAPGKFIGRRFGCTCKLNKFITNSECGAISYPETCCN